MTHISNLIGSSGFSYEEIAELNKYHNCPSKEMNYQEVRDACNALMMVIVNNCPVCEDRTTALQSVRLARMWANSAIALDKRVRETSARQEK